LPIRADVLTGKDVLGSVTPITLISSTTWDALNGETWADLNTWGNSTLGSTAFEELIVGDDIANTNKLIKFGKAMRFRKVNFSIRLQTDGSTTQPTKIFQYTALVAIKQKVSERIS